MSTDTDVYAKAAAVAEPGQPPGIRHRDYDHSDV
jgi:hypothetical protein